VSLGGEEVQIIQERKTPKIEQRFFRTEVEKDKLCQRDMALQERSA